MSENDLIISEEVRSRIYTIRGLQVMIDRDLASLYDVETRILNQAVKRNSERFPEEYCFQLNDEEFSNWISHIVMSNEDRMGLRRHPYVFTEQGVAMLSGVLRSDIAIKVSIQIMNAFVSMRRFISKNAEIFIRLDTVERKQLESQIKTDKNFERVFEAIEDKGFVKKQGIFFDGQIFDAYVFVSDLIRSAKESIVLIDNFIDDSVLTLFCKRNDNVSVVIYTKNLTKQLRLDLEKHNSQYPIVMIREFNRAHDRFMIIDDKEVYHIGASLKDLGKKWFAFSKFEKDGFKLIEKLK